MMTMAGKAALALLGGMALAAAQPAAAVPGDFEARADALLERAFPADGPGAAVIVTENGRTVYVRGRGLADVAAGRPIAPDTVFRLGSITKQFTAAVILQLANEGRLSLDDPLSRFLPDYPAPGAGATVRQLLNHTVGIQSYTGIPGWMVEANTARPHTTAEMIAAFRGLKVDSPFGPFEYRAVDHQATMGAWVGKTAVKDGKPVMVDWSYRDGKDHLRDDQGCHGRPQSSRPMSRPPSRRVTASPEPATTA